MDSTNEKLMALLDPGERAYFDQASRRIFKVMPGLGLNNYKGRYKYIDKGDRISGWKCMHNLPWADTREQAQKDLDELARKKKWLPVIRPEGKANG